MFFQIATLIVSLFGFSPGNSVSDSTSRLENELDAAIDSIAGPRIRAIASKARGNLFLVDGVKRTNAAHLFAAIGARKVILEMMGTKRFRSTVLDPEFFELIDADCLPRLYEVIRDWYPDGDYLELDGGARRLQPILNLHDHVAKKIFGFRENDLEPGRPSLETQAEFRACWLKLMALGSKKLAKKAPIDELIESIKNK